MKHIILFTISLITINLCAQTEKDRSNHITFRVQKPQEKDLIQLVEDLQEVVDTLKDEPVFFIVEEMPEYPGGELAIRQYLASNVKYPVKAMEREIEGRVYVQFVITVDGDVTGVKIARGVDPELNKEAIRVIKAMPKWTPGKQRGKPVAVAYTIPINFVLQ